MDVKLFQPIINMIEYRICSQGEGEIDKMLTVASWVVLIVILAMCNQD